MTIVGQNNQIDLGTDQGYFPRNIKTLQVVPSILPSGFVQIQSRLFVTLLRRIASVHQQQTTNRPKPGTTPLW
jgi:hypothetical protein